ncbi:MAG: hypothetical protein ACOYIK_04310 [Coriobacteriales bacterium]|jgi:tetrahydromethanopterin S-methyltransferase subunit H
MVTFEKEQSSFNIAGVKIGGQPGKLPTVMCGSLFYDRHKIVKDARTGDFDKAATKSLLEDERQLSEEFGLQRMPDVIGSTPEALKNYIDFMLEAIDGPMLVDSASIDTIIEALARYKGSEAMNRLVLSPIDANTTDEQLGRISDMGVKSALVMDFTPEAIMPDQKVKAITGSESGEVEPGSLLGRTRAAGVENILVDVGVIDLMGAAWSAMSVSRVKETLGLPAGCAPSNALFSWQKNHTDVLSTPEQKSAAGAAVYSSIVYSGADFVLYGPMRCASWAYPACAMANALTSYGNRLSGVRTTDRSHPLYKLK